MEVKVNTVPEPVSGFKVEAFFEPFPWFWDYVRSVPKWFELQCIHPELVRAYEALPITKLKMERVDESITERCAKYEAWTSGRKQIIQGEDLLIFSEQGELLKAVGIVEYTPRWRWHHRFVKPPTVRLHHNPNETVMDALRELGDREAVYVLSIQTEFSSADGGLHTVYRGTSKNVVVYKAPGRHHIVSWVAHRKQQERERISKRLREIDQVS
jgi:hypothetical protein